MGHKESYQVGIVEYALVEPLGSMHYLKEKKKIVKTESKW